MHSEPFASSSSGLTVARYSIAVLLVVDAGSRKRRCWTLAEQSCKRHSLVPSYTLHAMYEGMTSFTPFDPAPCDKKSRSEHQTLFLARAGKVWARDYAATSMYSTMQFTRQNRFTRSCSGGYKMTNGSRVRKLE